MYPANQIPIEPTPKPPPPPSPTVQPDIKEPPPQELPDEVPNPNPDEKRRPPARAHWQSEVGALLRRLRCDERSHGRQLRKADVLIGKSSPLPEVS